MKKAGTGGINATGLFNGLGRVLSLSALLLTAYVLRPMLLSAEVPVKFTYQGNLRQSGFLVNGQRNMVFRLYNSSDSASELWTSPVYGVSLSTGVFRVALEPAISDWESGSLWLELEIEGNRLSPREELTSSPYSVNSLMLSGKRYTTSAAAPAGSILGELWYDTGLKAVNFWNGTAWVPTSGSGVAETDPLSIHNQDVLQDGAVFYVSSGTVKDLNIESSLKVTGTALLKGAPDQQGLSVEATGNVGIGLTGAAARLEIRGVDTQNYSLAVGTGTAHQVVVSTSGALGIGTENPGAKLEVVGSESSGQYIAIFNSGAKTAAWLRNK